MGKYDQIRDILFAEPKSKNISFRKVKSFMESIGFTFISGSGSRYSVEHVLLDYPLTIHSHKPGQTLKTYEIKLIREAIDEVEKKEK